MGTSRRQAWELFGLFTAIGLLMFSSAYFDDLARHQSGTAVPRLLEELTGSWSVWVLVPIFRIAARHAELASGRWRRALPVLALGAIVYTALHTTLMLISRSLMFPLVGRGPYDYGVMTYRYPMEAAKDAIVFTIAVGAIALFERVASGRRAELDAAALRAQLAESRIENLQLQLQPHFLFNTLNAVSAVMYEDVAKADAMLAKLSDFLRIVLDSSGVQRVSVAEELRVEGLYVDLMRARLERGLDLRLAVDDDALSTEIPFMLLQPLLENCIRHGLAGGRTELGIDVAVRRARGDLVIDVSDDGAGLSSAPGRGLGLRNVRDRLARTYGEASTFAIGPRDGGGTRVSLSYPARGDAE